MIKIQFNNHSSVKFYENEFSLLFMINRIELTKNQLEREKFNKKLSFSQILRMKEGQVYSTLRV